MKNRLNRTSASAQSCAAQAILWLASGASNEGPSSPLLVPLPAVSWPWVPAWGSLEPSRRGGENAQKTRKNGEEMGEIRPKKCEPRELTKDQLAARYTKARSTTGSSRRIPSGTRCCPARRPRLSAAAMAASASMTPVAASDPGISPKREYRASQALRACA